MREKKKQRKDVQILQIITGILMLLAMVLMRFYVQGQYYSGWEILRKWISEKTFHPEYLFWLEWCFFTGLFGIRTALLLLRKSVGLLYDLATMSLWISCVPFAVIMQMRDPGPYMFPCITLLILSLIEFLGIRFLEQKPDMDQKYQRMKEKEMEEKKHKKRADHFPGKYPKEFYQIMQDYIRYYWKEQIIAFSGAAMIAAVTQTVLAVFLMAKELYQTEEIFSMLIGEGLYRMFRNLGMILLVISVFMMYMICSWYIREQQQSFCLLVILGIRKRTAYLIFLCEYMGILVAGAVSGTVLGAAISAVVKHAFAEGIPEASVSVEISGKETGLGLLIYLLEMFFALALNQENVLSLGKSTNVTDNVTADKRPQKRLVVWIASGMLLYGIGGVWFSIREWAEMDFIYLFLAGGVLLLLIGVFAAFLKWRRTKEAYYQSMFQWNAFYYRFWKNMGSLCLLSLVHVCILAIFAVQLIGTMTKQELEEMYPYDYVYKAYEADLPKMQEIIRENQIQAEVYPMLVMTSIYGSDQLAVWGGARPIQWPQGQQIAISESTYKKLKQNKGERMIGFQLHQEEMHVVYQQDLSAKAHTIDWDTRRVEKHLRFGQPLIYYNTADYQKIFPARLIKSEEKDSLIGNFCQGMQENLIVLSDDYFQKNWDRILVYNRDHWEQREQADLAEWRAYSASHEGNMTEGPTMLYCMNVPEDRKDTVGRELENLAEKHVFDQTWDRQIQSFYGKTQMMTNLKSEILFNRTAYGFIVFILIIILVFQYFVYVRKEEKSWKWEDIFLDRMGMRQKERKKKISFSLKLYLLVPLFMGVVSGVLYTFLTLRARLFSSEEILQYVEKMGIVYVVYIGIQVVVYQLARIHIRHYIRRR